MPQPSRKGKRAWRKNVDIADVEAGLEDVREREILVGKEDHDNGFVIDSSASNSGPRVKKSGTAEILSNKSKVPAVTNPRATQEKRVVKKPLKRTDYLKLVKLAGGRNRDESTVVNRIKEDGVISNANNDLWGAPTEEPKPIDNFSATNERTTASVVPRTLKEKPIKITKNELTEKKIHEGKSYNPSLESWKRLINQEYDVEFEKEANRQRIADHKEKIRELMVTMKDEELDEVDDMGKALVEEEEESVQNDDFRVSANPPSKNILKNRVIRNREKREKRAKQLEDELEALNKQLEDLENLDKILAAHEQKEPSKKRSRKVPSKLANHDIIEAPLEVKLSDEMTGSLRSLKAEGNLLYDQMLNLQSSGKVEARVPVAKRRKYAEKWTEKWTYKDFK